MDWANSRVSIHAPRGGSDDNRWGRCSEAGGFQSTLPAGGATALPVGTVPILVRFNPRSPRGERRGKKVPGSNGYGFQSTLPAGGATIRIRCPSRSRKVSIHAPRGGSDSRPPKLRSAPPKFQSTLPAGGATALASLSSQVTVVSIHAPRGGSDIGILVSVLDHPRFNPRSPRGERHVEIAAGGIFGIVSIHAPRGGSDHDSAHCNRRLE